MSCSQSLNEITSSKNVRLKKEDQVGTIVMKVFGEAMIRSQDVLNKRKISRRLFKIKDLRSTREKIYTSLC